MINKRLSVPILVFTLPALLALAALAGNGDRNGPDPWISINAGGQISGDSTGQGGLSFGQAVVGLALSQDHIASLGFWPQQVFDSLVADPDSLLGTLVTQPGLAIETIITLTNFGNTNAVWTSSVDYQSGSDWLSLSPTGGTINPVTDNTQEVTVTATGPATPGLYEATITISYAGDSKVLGVPVDLRCWQFIPCDVAMRTAKNRLNVQQVGRVANGDSSAGFTWFADGLAYLSDGSLIIGDSRNNLSFEIFHQLGETGPVDNPWKPLYALSALSYDSTSYPYYRYAEGNGCTGDSAIGFTSKYYGPKHPDTSQFYVAHFDIYAGPNWTSEVIGLRIAFACDWDVPSDTGFDNSPGLLADSMAVYQKGEYAGSPDNHDDRYAGLAYRADDSAYFPADGGFVWNSPEYVYPDEGYHVDSLIKYINQTETTPYFVLGVDILPITDYSSVVVAARDAVIGADDTISFSVIIAATNPNVKGLGDLENAIFKGSEFICDYVSPEAPHCFGCAPCKCGDADENGIWNISDCVRVIGYVFGGEPPPSRPCSCDCDGNKICNISDAVCSITYIFGGGPEPGGCDPCQEWP